MTFSMKHPLRSKRFEKLVMGIHSLPEVEFSMRDIRRFMHNGASDLGIVNLLYEAEMLEKEYINGKNWYKKTEKLEKYVKNYNKLKSMLKKKREYKTFIDETIEKEKGEVYNKT